MDVPKGTSDTLETSSDETASVRKIKDVLDTMPENDKNDEPLITRKEPDSSSKQQQKDTKYGGKGGPAGTNLGNRNDNNMDFESSPIDSSTVSGKGEASSTPAIKLGSDASSEAKVDTEDKEEDDDPEPPIPDGDPQEEKKNLKNQSYLKSN